MLEWDMQRLFDSASVPLLGTARGAVSGSSGSASAAASCCKRIAFLGGLERLSLATWNSNGLLGLNPKLSAKKLGCLRRLLNNYDIVILQESWDI